MPISSIRRPDERPGAEPRAATVRPLPSFIVDSSSKQRSVSVSLGQARARAARVAEWASGVPALAAGGAVLQCRPPAGPRRGGRRRPSGGPHTVGMQFIRYYYIDYFTTIINSRRYCPVSACGRARAQPAESDALPPPGGRNSVPTGRRQPVRRVHQEATAIADPRHSKTQPLRRQQRSDSGPRDYPPAGRRIMRRDAFGPAPRPRQWPVTNLSASRSVRRCQTYCPCHLDE